MTKESAMVIRSQGLFEGKPLTVAFAFSLGLDAVAARGFAFIALNAALPAGHTTRLCPLPYRDLLQGLFGLVVCPPRRLLSGRGLIELVTLGSGFALVHPSR